MQIGKSKNGSICSSDAQGNLEQHDVPKDYKFLVQLIDEPSLELAAARVNRMFNHAGSAYPVTDFVVLQGVDYLSKFRLNRGFTVYERK